MVEVSATNGLLTIVGLLLGLVIWMLKRNTDKVSGAVIDIAVIKSTIEYVKPDHDKITIIEHDQKMLKTSVNGIGIKLKNIEKRLT